MQGTHGASGSSNIPNVPNSNSVNGSSNTGGANSQSYTAITNEIQTMLIVTIF